jgi:hypothetical protein
LKDKEEKEGRPVRKFIGMKRSIYSKMTLPIERAIPRS